MHLNPKVIKCFYCGHILQLVLTTGSNTLGTIFAIGHNKSYLAGKP